MAITKVEGGWVSQDLEPDSKGRVFLRNAKPYYAPDSLDELKGPKSGMVKLPIHLYWGGEKLFQISSRNDLRSMYQAVLEEGNIEDFEVYLNKEILSSIWSDLWATPRAKMLWDEKVWNKYA